MGNSETPLRPGEREALEQLETYIASNADTESVTRATAINYLAEQGLERADARDRIKRLLLKGYLYEVDEDLRIPPRSG